MNNNVRDKNHTSSKTNTKHMKMNENNEKIEK